MIIYNMKVTLLKFVKFAKFVLKKRLNTSLKDLSTALNNHGWHGLFSCLRSFPISV